MYGSLRERFPTVSANKIINFIVEGHLDTSDAAFQQFLYSQRDEIKPSMDAEIE